jgi:sodium-dependent phosphate transporter
MGIGLMEGSGGVNWRQFGKQFASWVSTLFVVGLGVGALFAQGVYSPSKIDSTMTLAYKNQVSALSTAVYKDFNTTLYSYRNASISNAIPTLTPAQFSLLNATIANGAKSVSTLKDPTKGVARPEAVLKALYGALNVVQNNTVSTLGQITIFPNATQCNTNNTQLLLAGNAAPVQCKAPKIAPPTLKV